MDSNQRKKWKQIAQWYSYHLNLYKRQIPIDMDLATSSKPKMRTLIDQFLERVKDFNIVLDDIRKEAGDENKKERSTEKLDIIAEEFEQIKKAFEKITATTPKLIEVERKVEEKIKAYEKLQTENSLMESIEKSPRNKVTDVNEKWLDNLINETTQHNNKIKELTKAKRSPNKNTPFLFTNNQSMKGRSVVSYLSGFKIIQDEFVALRKQMNSLVEEQQKQNSQELTEDIHKISVNVDKIAEDNELIKKDHAELFHTISILGTFVFKCM